MVNKLSFYYTAASTRGRPLAADWQLLLKPHRVYEVHRPGGSVM